MLVAIPLSIFEMVIFWADDSTACTAFAPVTQLSHCLPEIFIQAL